jgi:hypothetical protein
VFIFLIGQELTMYKNKRDLYIGHQSKPFYQKKILLIPLTLFLILFVLILMLEPYVERRVNNELSTMSNVLDFKVDDIDINYLGATIHLNEIKGHFKDSGNEFLSIQKVSTTLSWKDAFQGDFLAKVRITGLGLRYSQKLFREGKVFQEELKTYLEKKGITDRQDGQKKKKDKVSAFQLTELKLISSSVTLVDYPALKPGQAPHLSQIQGTMRNLTPSKEDPLSDFHLKAVLLEAGGLESWGQVNLKADPLKWSVDSEIQQLNLRSLNDFLMNKLPLSFSQGELDLYAEAKSEAGVVDGYVKPFLKDIIVTENKVDFQGVRHWFFEVLTATSNLILRAPDKKSVATRVPFTFNGSEVKVDTGQALGKAIKHGFKEKLERGIENKFNLD